MGRVFALILFLSIFPQEKSWGQGSVQEWSARTESATTTELDSQPTETVETVAPNEDPEVMEAERLRKEAANDPNAKLGQEIDRNLIELQSAMKGDVSALTILMDSKMRESLGKMFESNPLQLIPDSIIEENLQKTNFGPIFKKFPFLLRFMKNFMKHPNAFSQLLKVFERREAMKVCGITSIVLMILIIFIKRKVISPKIVWWRRFLISQCFNCMFFFTLIIIYSVTFSTELAPTFQVLKESLF